MVVRCAQLQREHAGTVLILGARYISELSGGKLTHRMDHLACFWPGTLALAAMALREAAADSSDAAAHLNLAERLAHTCAHLALESTLGLAPESVSFNPSAGEGEQQYSVLKPAYHLRPEVLESMFYLWRATKDEKCGARVLALYLCNTLRMYRQWGAQIWNAIVDACRTGSA
jgi:mannosyl-oligosaccharide alpha-1,2-mannosidase